MNQPKECPCPACGFYSIGETSFGSFELCDICGWEDDSVMLANPASAGGANTKSLLEKQEQLLLEIPLNIKEIKGIKRDPSWRPLNQIEKEKFRKESETKHWKNSAIEDLNEVYWNN